MARSTCTLAACCLLLSCMGFASAFIRTCSSSKPCTGANDHLASARAAAPQPSALKPARPRTPTCVSALEAPARSSVPDGCTADLCFPDTFCVNVTGVCVSGCMSDANCAGGKQCVLGQCKDCPALDDSCLVPGTSQQICSGPSRPFLALSGPSKGCVYRDVPAQCSSCPAGNICSLTGVCIEGCTDDSGCDDGKQCILGKCKACGGTEINPAGECLLPGSPLPVRVCSGGQSTNIFTTLWQCKFSVDPDCNTCGDGEVCNTNLGVCRPDPNA